MILFPDEVVSVEISGFCQVELISPLLFSPRPHHTKRPCTQFTYFFCLVLTLVVEIKYQSSVCIRCLYLGVFFKHFFYTLHKYIYHFLHLLTSYIICRSKYNFVLLYALSISTQS